MLGQLVGKIGSAKLQRMLGKALIACQRDYTSLRELLEQQNWEQATKQAHSLKTTAGLLECQEFVHILEMIEQKNPDFINQPECLQQLEREYLRCVDAMQQLLPPHAEP